MAKEYQGHHCWNCWNISLWVANDEGLYRLAVECKRQYRRSSKNAARLFIETVGYEARTPDGGRYLPRAVQHAIRNLE